MIGRAWPFTSARLAWPIRRWHVPSWRRFSVRTRLTVWYVALLAGTLIGLITLGWWLSRQQLYGNADEVLRSKAAAVVSEVDVSKGKLSFSFDGAKKGSPPLVAVGLDVLRVWDANHRLIYRFPPGAQLGQPGPTTLDETLTGIEQFATVQSDDGTLLRVLYQPIIDKGKIIGAIEVGRSQGELDALLARMRELGLLGVVLGLIVAWAGGSFLADRVLRPVDQIRLAAERIGAEDLSLGLEPPATQDELGRLVSAFNNMIERLDRAFQQQQRFTADASHELRTPLTVIRSLADVALSSPPDQAYDRRVLASICEESDRLGRLLESLLVLARADQGQVLLLDAVDLDDVLLDAAERIALRARQQGIHLQVVPTDGERVMGDASLLTQLLVNLLENAVRHTPAGGQIALSASRAPTTGEVVLTVADSGEGIALEHLPRLFDRFYRVDSARSRGTGGFGLGLAICQWIVQAHRGTIAVESTAGVGTTFKIRLPSPPSGIRGLVRPATVTTERPERVAAH
jgi:heavy metal sensor kinase